MRNLLFIIVLVAIGACGLMFLDKEYGTEPRLYPEIPRPPDIPDTMSDGTKIEWDGPWHDAYQLGDVIITWKDTSDHSKGVTGLTRIIRDVKPWMRGE